MVLPSFMNLGLMPGRGYEGNQAKKKEINKYNENKQKERNKQINNTATCSRGGKYQQSITSKETHDIGTSFAPKMVGPKLVRVRLCEFESVGGGL